MESTPKKTDESGSAKRKSEERGDYRLSGFGVGDATPPIGFNLWSRGPARATKRLKLEDKTTSPPEEATPQEEKVLRKLTFEDVLKDKTPHQIDLKMNYAKEIMKNPPKKGSFLKFRCSDELGLEVSVCIFEEEIQKKMEKFLQPGSTFRLVRYSFSPTQPQFVDQEPSSVSICLGKSSELQMSTAVFDAPPVNYVPIGDIKEEMFGSRINICGVIGYRTKGNEENQFGKQRTLLVTDQSYGTLRVVMYKSDAILFKGEPGDSIVIMHGLVKEYMGGIEMKVETVGSYVMINSSILKAIEVKEWFDLANIAGAEGEEDFLSQMSGCSLTQEGLSTAGSNQEETPAIENVDENDDVDYSNT